jgi:regulator of RNase E activity RraA
VSVDLATVRAKLYSSVISDTLDSLGRTQQAMRPFVRPLDDSSVLVGRARTGLYMPVYEALPDENPYEIEMALIDDLKEGEVAVLACDGPTERIAPWGELLSTAAHYRGAVGCVTDGLVRDIRQIRSMNFPVFCGGIGPLDSRGRGKMMAMDVAVACGGVVVRPGDLLVGDADGVVVVPKEIEAEVLEAALAKVECEDRTREELARGAKLAEVYAKYGVL